MSRKRRKSYKGRKSSDSREYEHLSVTCKCQRNVENIENKVDEALAHFPEALEVKGSEENGKDHETKNRSSTDASEDKELDNTSDSEKEGKKEKNRTSQVFPPQQNEILATVTFGESEGSLMGKITVWGKPDSAESASVATGRINAEVKYGSFNVKVEIQNVSLFDSGTNFVTEKKKCSKNSKHCHERQYQKSQCSSCPKYQSPPADHLVVNIEEYKESSAHKIQTIVNKNSFLKMDIEGKTIKMEYTNRKKNLKVNIEPGEQAQRKTCNREQEDTYWKETDYSVKKAPCNTDCESCFHLHEKEDTAFQDGYILLPPPKEFADCDKMHLDTITEGVSSYPANDRKESDSLSTALRFWEGENYFCKHNKNKNEGHNNEKEDFSKDKILFSKMNNTNCLVASNTLNNSNVGKECINRNSAAGQERNNINKCNDTGQKPARRKSFPDTTLDVASPVHPRRDSGFYSLPSLSLKVLPKETKADICFKNSLVHASCTELSKCPDMTSSLRSLKALKSSYQYAFTSFDHNVTVYPSEPDGSLDDTCLLNDYADYVEQSEETGQKVMENLHSLEIINEKKETENAEPLRNLAIWEEDSESSEDTLDEETPEHHLEKNVDLQNKAQLIQVFPPSKTPSEEFISDKERSNYASIECIPNQLSAIQQNVKPLPAETEVVRKRRGSVMTVITGELERRIIVQGDNKLVPDPFGSAVKKEPNLSCSVQEKSMLSHLILDLKEHNIDNELESFSEIQDVSGDTHVEASCHNDSAQTALLSTSSTYTESKEIFTEHSYIKEGTENVCSKRSPDDSIKTDAGAHHLPQLVKSSSDEVEKNIEMKEVHQNTDFPPSSVKQISQKDLKSEMNKNRKLPVLKDTRASDSSQEEAIDQWARRRKQFKDSKKCSSTGGSSINSTITEGSMNSEDARSVDLGLHSENDDRGFYTENFHSAAWVFRGDDVSPDNSPRCLSKRPRPVAIRERTVKIAKGTGNYPWGFRIQFSKPILVTEVDTNSAAEEAGLQVGDILIAVNGTDVTSMPHSEAANLARKGPDILTMVVGSDISRYPNTPRPTCRGYLHKRTQSAILKGWRKRWFVLKHNGYLHYYKHKKDEGKCRPLEVTKLEGAEIGVDTSLGKPFVFKCIPQSGNRIFYFCATSNQEMKRWLEAMEKAVHPVHQNHVWVDVTLHNTTLPPLAIKNPECLGLLHELDRSKDAWIQHYCILKDGCLYFYATLRSTPAQGGLYLQGYIVSEQSLGSKRSVIELKPPSEEFKTFYLCAENVNENKRWITALKASINKWLPLHQAIQDFMNRPLEETRM
uniref:PDZ and pleckstrin homology domains 1, pseudo n=1 Tax=Coturnix japonica TaxID=93934 RepID=A0A8C2TGP4_COTJA